MDPTQQADPRVMTVMQQTGLPYAAAAQIVAQMGQAPASPGIMGSLGQAMGGLGEGLGQFGQKAMQMQQGAPQAADPLGLRTGAFNALKGGMDPMGLRTATGNALTGAPQAAAGPPPSPVPPSPPPANGPDSAQSESPAASGSPATGQGARDNNAADYPGRAPASPSPDTKDATKGPEQSAASPTGGAPAQATTPQSAATPPTGSPYNASAFPGARDLDVYGLRDNDTLDSFGRRILRQGLADNGNSLLTDPTTANSPFAQFMLNRYSGDVASKMATQIASGQVQPGQEASTTQGMLKAFASGGGAPSGGVSFDDLRGAASAFNRYAAGDTNGMNTSQTDYLKGHADDYGGLSNMFVNAARASSGGWGTRGAQMLASNLYDRYNDDSAYALQNGPFLSALLKQAGG